MKKLILLLILSLSGCLLCEAQTRDAEEIVTLTLLGEARCQNEEGMRAIGQVLLNRSRKSGKSVSFEALKPKQFSCWNDGTLSERSEAIKAESEQATRLAESIAAFICNDMDVHSTKANHYYQPDLCSPSWAEGVKGVKIGDHLFLEL